MGNISDDSAIERTQTCPLPAGRGTPDRFRWAWIAGAVLLAASPSLAPAQGSRSETPKFRAELELGAVWQSKNEVQIPNDDSATRFSLVDLIGNGPIGAGRLRAFWRTGERHELHALLAPLTFEESGTPEDAVTFAGTTFEADRELEATYQFNSWRVGYRYRLASGPRGQAWIGFTAKLRDAEVRLDQDGTSAKDTDLGFVPLLHLAGSWQWTPDWGTFVEIEALGGGPGRAIDGAVKLRYGSRSGTGVSLGYRTLEGGADVDAVYNFAWLHYAVFSIDVPLR